MNQDSKNKIQSHHLAKSAYLYIRQSTLKQVQENIESTERQYALKNKAHSLGWQKDKIIIIDEDLGISGSGQSDRSGFKKLLLEVSLGNAGVVIGLEVSRFARNSSDWHRLLEICALSNTLIMDEDGIYDTSHFNDRLLLGLKGTMSEAELYVIRSRLRGGMLNKAHRGELCTSLPVGLSYDEQNKVRLSSDLQVRSTISKFFEKFSEVGSAFKTIQYFNHNGIGFPHKKNFGKKETLTFGTLSHSQALKILKNPRYAGVYFYGRSQSVLKNGKKSQVIQEPEKWHTRIMNAHTGYITWDQYIKNQEVLAINAQIIGKERKVTPPREGPAALQGIAICGKCGRKLSVRYQVRNGRVNPSYRCISNKKDYAASDCQIIPGTEIDKLISEKLLKIVEVDTIEIAYAVKDKLIQKHDELIKSLELQLERTQYQTHLAQQRFMRVDPANRLVADNLEFEWNEQLKKINEEKENLLKIKAAKGQSLNRLKNNELKKLVTDFDQIWNDPNISNREKKRIIQLIIEDVTILRTAVDIEVNIRFRGGKVESYKLDLPKNPFIELKTSASTVTLIDMMLNKFSETETALKLNQQGYLTGAGLNFNRKTINNIKIHYKLPSYRDRLKLTGFQTAKEIAALHCVDINIFKKLREDKKIEFRSYHKSGYLYRLDDPKVLFRSNRCGGVV